MAPVIIIDKYKFVVFDPDERVNVSTLKHYTSRKAAEAALDVKTGKAQPKAHRKPSKKQAAIHAATEAVAEARLDARKEMHGY